MKNTKRETAEQMRPDGDRHTVRGKREARAFPGA